MRVLIAITILAIVAFGLYKTLKAGDDTPNVPGGAGHGHEYTGEEQPDDEEHDE